MNDTTWDVRVRVRATAIWLAVTGAAAVAVAVGAPEAMGLVTAPARGFADLLVQVCAVGAVGAAGWLWVLASHVAVLAWRGAEAVRSARLGPFRGFLLTLCGVAALSSTTPALGAPDNSSADAAVSASALAGLPLPDRATGTGQAPRVEPPAAVRVGAGDALWTIAERHLGPHAEPVDVANYTARLHAVNRGVIGPDPDLIHPGQQLRLPPA